MQGIGELFGSAFDDVIRRPTPAIVPAVVDVALLLVGAVVLSTTLGIVAFAHAPQGLPVMPFTVPEPLPSVTDLRDPTGPLLGPSPRTLIAVATVWLLSIPVLAYARGGFIGLLLEVYLPRGDDPLDRGPAGFEELRGAFTSHASAAFGPLLLIGLLEAVVGLAAVALPATLPYFRNSLLGLIAFDFLTMFAPYIVVIEGKGALASLRKSVRTVSDFLASSLVALLFGLLVTGGLGALLGPVVAFVGPAGLLVGAVLFAPVGAILALFYLKVYLSFHPTDRYPIMAKESPAAAQAPAEA